MYKVFQTVKSDNAKENRWEIFWCPSAPYHFMDKLPHDGKAYSTRAAAYRRVKQLNDALKKKPAA